MLFSNYKKIKAFKDGAHKIFINNHPLYKKFITVSNIGRNGRLGNQLFQYATARAYSIKHDIPIILPSVKYGRMKDFQVKCRFIKQEYLNYLNKITYKEKSFNFDNNLFLKYDRCDFDGFFQTEKYFKDIRDRLLIELLPKKEEINISNYFIGFLSV